MLLERVIADAHGEGYDAVEGCPEKGDADAYYSYPGRKKLYRRLGYAPVGKGESRLIVRKKLA